MAVASRGTRVSARCGSGTFRGSGTQAAKTVDGLSPPWVEAAVAVALNGRKPRVTGVAPAVELAQLTRALSRVGLVLILEPAEPDHAPAALVRALEWIAQNAPVAVVAIFPQLPANDPPWGFSISLDKSCWSPGISSPTQGPSAQPPGSPRGAACRIRSAISSSGSQKCSQVTPNWRRFSASTRSLRRCAGRSLGLISSGWKDG
jgi:hypothetical protein